jgi:hypothetical protein
LTLRPGAFPVLRRMPRSSVARNPCPSLCREKPCPPSPVDTRSMICWHYAYYIPNASVRVPPIGICAGRGSRGGSRLRQCGCVQPKRQRLEWDGDEKDRDGCGRSGLATEAGEKPAVQF